MIILTHYFHKEMRRVQDVEQGKLKSARGGNKEELKSTRGGNKEELDSVRGCSKGFAHYYSHENH